MTIISSVTSIYKFQPTISKEQAIDDYAALKKIKGTAEDAITSSRFMLTIPGMRKDEIEALVKTVDFSIETIKKIDVQLNMLKYHVAGTVYETI